MLTSQSQQTIPAVPLSMKKAQENVAGSMGSNPGALGPSPTTPQQPLEKPKKKSPIKYILGGIVLVLLVFGMITGFYLTQRSQDVRQQASEIYARTNISATPIDPAIRSRNCKGIQKNNAQYANQSGTYNVYPNGVAMAVYCDMTTDGGGWTMVARGFQNQNEDLKRSNTTKGNLPTESGILSTNLMREISGAGDDVEFMFDYTIRNNPPDGPLNSGQFKWIAKTDLALTSGEAWAETGRTLTCIGDGSTATTYGLTGEFGARPDSLHWYRPGGLAAFNINVGGTPIGVVGTHGGMSFGAPYYWPTAACQAHTVPSGAGIPVEEGKLYVRGTDAPSQCNDGIDNDGDGKIDCTVGAQDPGCYPDGNGGGGVCDPNDDDETDVTECNDGIDNDGDGLIDCTVGASDLGCYPDGNGGGGACDPNDDDETDVPNQCNDGIDNDGDGKIDCRVGAQDPGCYPDGNGGGGACNPNDDDETNQTVVYASPTPTLSPSPVATPTLAPSPTLIATATVIPTPTPTSAPGCNEKCYSNSDCADTNAVCYNELCRLATNPTSTTCQPVEEVQNVGNYYEQPQLPQTLPESGSKDILNWIKVGLGTLGLGLLFFLL